MLTSFEAPGPPPLQEPAAAGPQLAKEPSNMQQKNPLGEKNTYIHTYIHTYIIAYILSYYLLKCILTYLTLHYITVHYRQTDRQTDRRIVLKLNGV